MNLGEELAALIAPLAQALASPAGADALLRDLGVLTTPAAPPAVPQVLADLASTAEQTVDALLALDDPAVSPADRIAGLITNLGELFGALDALSDLDSADLTGMAWPFDAPEVWPILATGLPGYLLVRWLRERHDTWYEALTLLEVVGPGELGVPRVDLSRLTSAFSSIEISPVLLVEPLRRWFDARGLSAPRRPLAITGQADADEGFAAEPVWAGGDRFDVTLPGVPGFAAAVSAGTGLELSAEGLDQLSSGLVLGDWTLQGIGDAGVAGLVLEPGSTKALPDATLDSAGIELAGHPAQPWILLGSAGATRLELASASLGLTGEQLLDAPELAIAFGGQGLRLVLSAGDADSFLATILGAAEIGAGMNLSGRWSTVDGLRVDGGGGLTIRIPVAVTLGPITVHGLTLAALIDGDELTLELTADVSGQIGPVTALVAGMGLRLRLGPAVPGLDDQLRIGPVGGSLAVKPPSGLGFGVDAGIASGGGYLYFSPETGRYDGVIDIQVLTVGISAFTLIDTKAPDVDGWSLFLALFLDLPAIQLGFGFTLTGVGGLAGINRTIDTAALEAAVRSGSLDAALFPADPIEDAIWVIDTLRTLFPPSNNQYVFGPVIRIGWGTPSLIEAEVGVVITLPDPVIVVVLGTVTSILPTPDLDLVALHLDVAGVVDFTAGTLAIDASLHDSHVACFALSGDMALRAGFGDAPSFLLALGGFHPGFAAPAGFPALQRLRLALSAAPVLDVSFECYFALTSNTVQFGADFELSAEIAGFGVSGGAQFDALVYFSPFKMTISAGWYVSVTAAGFDLLGVWLDATVSGPNPWRVIGDARFTILGIRESIHIDERIGQPRTEPALPAADPRDEIVTALENPDSWSTVATGAAGVLLTGDTALAARPDGSIRVSQKVAPLGVRLDKIGDEPIGNYHTFDVVAAPDGLVGTGRACDWFAPGHYFELAPKDRLSTPSFEWLDSGTEFGGGAPRAGRARQTTLDFEEILRDPELGEDRVHHGRVNLAADRTGTLTFDGGPASRTRGFQIAADPEAVTLNRSAYAVTDRLTGRAKLTTGTWSAARQSAPGGRAANTVVPTWELFGDD